MTNKKILVIEDDEDISRSLRELLTDEGFDVTVAVNGQAGLAQLREAGLSPSVILLDLMMPVMDGFQFRREQEQDSRLSDIPVAIMTAAGNIETKRMEVGASAFIKKPIDVETLLEVVDRLAAS